MQQERNKYEKVVIDIPPHCFRHKSGSDQVAGEQAMVTPLVKLEWNKGIFQYLENAEYPMKGFTTSGTMFYLNFAKRHLVRMMKMLSKWYFFPTYLLFAVMPWKIKVKIMEQFMETFIDSTHRLISPVILKEDFMTPVAQEIEWATYSFFNNIGISSIRCDQFSELIGALIENDTAYRYRIGDIFSETTKTKIMDNPAKEIMRLLKIAQTRESYSIEIKNKYKFVALGIRLLIIHPKFKKAFKAAISEIDVRKMALDEADQYWVCLRDSNEYLFMGKTAEERKELIKGKKVPTLIKNKKHDE